MAYLFYLGNTLLPVAPSSLKLKVNNKNKTMSLIDNGEITILKQAGLTDIDFEVLIPNVSYPFATYKNGFENAKFFTDKLKGLKARKRPFRFKVIRELPDGRTLCDTDEQVSLESYSISEDAKNLFDLTVSISLKEYKSVRAKTCNVTFDNAKPIVTVTTKRDGENSPTSQSSHPPHTVAKGDCLYNIALKYYGNGDRYPDIYAANKKVIDEGNDGTGNPRYTIYQHQVFVIPV